MKKTFEMWPNIIHLQFDSQYELTSTFVRMQEFYESPFANIRHKVFTMDQFMDTYAEANEGVFSYFEDWAGFNVPGDMVINFFNFFSHCLREKEVKMLMELNQLPSDGKFYVIGTYGSKKNCAIEHELAHAFYYLHDDYRADCGRMLCKVPVNVYNKMEARLFDMGYTESVILDEVQAYLSTSNDAHLVKLFGLDEEELKSAVPFRGSYYGRRSGIY